MYCTVTCWPLIQFVFHPQISGARLLKRVLNEKQVAEMGSLLGALLVPAVGTILICILSCICILLISTVLGHSFGVVGGAVIGSIIGTLLTPVYLVFIRRLLKSSILRMTWQLGGAMAGSVISTAILLSWFSELDVLLHNSILYISLVGVVMIFFGLVIGLLIGTYLGPAVGAIPGATLGAVIGHLQGIGLMSLFGWVIGTLVGSGVAANHLRFLKYMLSPIVRPAQVSANIMDSTTAIMTWDLLNLTAPCGFATLLVLVLIFNFYNFVFWSFIAILQFSLIIGLFGPIPEISFGSFVGSAIGISLGALLGNFLFEILISLVVVFIVALTIIVPWVGVIWLRNVMVCWNEKLFIRNKLSVQPVILIFFQIFLTVTYISVVAPSLMPLIKIMLSPNISQVLGPAILSFIALVFAALLQPMFIPFLKQVYLIYFKVLSSN